MALPRKFRLARRRDAAQRGHEVDAELRFHLDERIEELVASGLPRPEAERVARERFGDVASVRAELEVIDANIDRRRSHAERLATLTQQGRLALRALARRPSFSLVSWLTLALGCGAVTAAFALVNTILLRPLPFPRPDELMMVSLSAVLQGKPMQMDQSDAGFLLFERDSRALDRIAAYRVRSLNVSLPSAGTTAGEAERMEAATVSASFFATLGVTQALGRLFVAGEDRAEAAPVAVISHALWQRTFGGDPAVIGKSLVVHGVNREIVGVMPAGFQYPTPSTELWVPAPFSFTTASPASFDWYSIARLKPGVSIEAATRELDQLVARVVEVFPGEVPPAMWEAAHVRSVIRPLREALTGNVRELLWILMASAALVLVVACANVAGLFLVRAEDGRHELAVRRALGAGTATAHAQYVTEAALISIGGALAGLALAATGLHALRLLPVSVDLPRLAEVTIDARVLTFTLFVVVLCVAALSLLPLLRARHLPVAAVLKSAGRGAIGGVATQRSRHVLVVAQVAMAMVLVSGSGLLARSFLRLRSVRPGFDGAHVLTMHIALPSTNYPTAEDRARFESRLLDEVSRVPGVQQSAITSWIPLSGDAETGAVDVEGIPRAPDEVPPVHSRVYVTDSLFRVMGTPMIEGRVFSPLDATRPSDEVIVSRSFAQRYWPGVSAIGKRVRQGIGGDWTRVVGVVEDVHLTSLQLPADEAVYLPMLTLDPGRQGGATWGPSVVALVVRTDGAPSSLVRPLRDVLHRLDPALPSFNERELADVMHSATARMRFTFLLLGASSLLTLLLGAVGIYGVLAYGVALRRREFGVRMALGARPSDVRRVVSRQGVRLAVLGVATGLVLTLGAMRLIGGLLYDVSPNDPVTLVATSVALLSVAFLASWIPARRASRMAPTVALRGD